jgi:hypothetical protein
MSTFPSYATILGEGYTQRRDSALQRTQMESGPPKQLKKVSRVMVTRSVTVLLSSQADFASFIDWYQDDLNYGADWFTWTDPLDHAAKSARIVSKLDVEEPVEAALLNWKVQFMLETWSG